MWLIYFKLSYESSNESTATSLGKLAKSFNPSNSEFGKESSLKIGKECRFVVDDTSRKNGLESKLDLNLVCLSETLNNSSCFLKYKCSFDSCRMLR
jgi:hypothetical protein